jgi:hypothetical protein
MPFESALRNNQLPLQILTTIQVVTSVEKVLEKCKWFAQIPAKNSLSKFKQREKNTITQCNMSPRNAQRTLPIVQPFTNGLRKVRPNTSKLL